MTTPLTIALLCGGPSLERGISLNSARSVMDHLQSDTVTIAPIYFNQKRVAFVLSPGQLYSNTPADFDFKLGDTSLALSDEQLEKELKNADIVFSVMHGAFGEDGTIQKWMEDRDIAFVGSPSAACKKAFDKYRANEFIKQQGFFTLPSCLLKIYKGDENKKATEAFFTQHNITRAIVKPAAGGSSIGVFSVSTASEALEKADVIFGKRMDTRVVIEPFVEGREFTVIILESRFGLPVAIMPTEMEIDYSEHQIFDFRTKYLPTRQVTYHCPPRFDNHIIETIQLQAEQLFVTLGMKDFTRFDGWVLEDGSIWFSDFNPISGMEQNSFLFQQSTRVGLSHTDVLSHIVARACERQGITHPFEITREVAVDNRVALPILMGGDSSERQVSLMSGTNVWLKLRHNSKKFRPIPYLMDIDGELWRVPYQLMLNHTVEEIVENCQSAALHEERIGRFELHARAQLGFTTKADPIEFGNPERVSLDDVLENHDRVFLALHGGMGEDGTMQELLEKYDVAFNGPGSVSSSLCINKQYTADAVAELGLEGVFAIPGKTITFDELTLANADDQWNELLKVTTARTLIAKPVSDGCSSGVVHLFDASDLATYISFLSQTDGFIPPETFRGQSGRIELPTQPPDAIRFEKYLRSDSIRVKAGGLKHVVKSNLIEVTVGVVERNGKMHAFNPSITIVDGELLSVEEKFQGGTGINVTPPPTEIMSDKVRKHVLFSMEEIATQLDVRGYCRIDAFVNCSTGDIHVIEINTLPALTPSTVLFQQALAEDAPMYPTELLELVADNK